MHFSLANIHFVENDMTYRKSCSKIVPATSGQLLMPVNVPKKKNYNWLKILFISQNFPTFCIFGKSLC